LIKYKINGHNLEEICQLIQDFIDESVFKVKINKERINKILNFEQCLTAVAYKNEKPIGIIMGYLYEHPLFEAKIADDFLLYVNKEHRGGFTGVKLIKIYKDWASHQDINYIFISQSTGVGNVEKVALLYEKMGFQTMGFNCMKEN
jgi:GNAT superfamily N-acetyltransferase